MVCENFCHRSWLFLFLRLDLFKEIHELIGIITRLIHVLDSQVIGFSFKAAGELEEGHRNADSGRFPGCQANPAADEDQRKAHVIGKLISGELSGSMAGSYMCYLMRHHACQFSLVIGGQNQPGIDIEEATW